jgi:hypothetical protein
MNRQNNKEERKENECEVKARVHCTGVLIVKEAYSVSVKSVNVRAKRTPWLQRNSQENQGTLLEAREQLTISRLVVTREERLI